MIMGLLYILSKVLTLTKAEITIIWVLQWLVTMDQEAFRRISPIGKDWPTKFVRFITKGIIKIHIDNIQQQ